ncbi:MAG: thioredoxin [Thermoplasmataceae archaeon]|jgi:thioredoxin 1
MTESEDNNIEAIRQNLLKDIMSQKVKNVKPIELSDENFMQSVASEKILVVDFWAAWCGPCRYLSPVIEELAKDYSGKVTFGKLNVDENPNVSAEFNIRSIPTVLMFKDGKMVDMSIGAVPKPMLDARIKKLLN